MVEYKNEPQQLQLTSEDVDDYGEPQLILRHTTVEDLDALDITHYPLTIVQLNGRRVTSGSFSREELKAIRDYIDGFLKS